jgi:hypothetical protein
VPEWTDELLDRLRLIGDPDADEAMARVAAEAAGADAAHAALRRMTGSAPGGHADGRAPIDEWLARPVHLPPWADADMIHCGQGVFHRHGLLIGLTLYCASLPEAYASARGSKALWLTGRLVTTTDRRINETAQFLIDALEPGALERSTGLDAISRVRLMHASVRWFIESDPAVEKVDNDDATGWCWSSTWGVPINQEELLGTLLTFTLVVFGALERLGVPLTADEREAYLHTWCVIGYLLGIDPSVLPFDLASARQLEPIIARRMQAPSEEGRELERALLSSTAALMPRLLRSVPLHLTRRCASPRALEVLGIGAPTGQGRPLRALTALENDSRLVRMVAAWVGTELLRGLVRAGRGTRPPFAIPDALGGAWGVDPRSPRLRAGITAVTRAARPATAGTRAATGGQPPR